MRLRDHREEIAAMLRAGKTQSEVARHFGVTPSGMSRFLTGHNGKRYVASATEKAVSKCVQRFFDAVEPVLRDMLFEAVQRKLSETGR